jgi:3-hydroxymyristoyl/3-hydroxydecanoyl-(acyl carrier protein) dehydratase
VLIMDNGRIMRTKRTKTVKFNTPIFPEDKLELEVMCVGPSWDPIWLPMTPMALLLYA